MQIVKAYKFKKAIAVVVMAFFISSCGSDGGTTDNLNDSTEQTTGDPSLAVGTESPGTVEQGSLRITAMKPSGKFDGASIAVDEQASVVNEMFVKKYRFNVDGMDINDPANNIILIHNNYQTQTLLRPSGKQALMPKANNVILAYLYNIQEGSIRTPTSYVLKNELFEVADQFDPTASHLFYNYPRGTYEMSDQLQIPLDFFVLNATLAPEKYHVRVTIDSTSFEVTHWSTYMIQGLTEGEHTCRIELLDHDGVNIFGPFTDSGTRTFEILTSEEIASRGETTQE